MPAPLKRRYMNTCLLYTSLLNFLAAKASIAINKSGFILSTIPANISPVSIPVIPITPGEIADTDATLSSMFFGSVSFICLVTSTLAVSYTHLDVYKRQFLRPDVNVIAASSSERVTSWSESTPIK